MVQDQTGFVWFGTENGISRFDGSSFKNFTLDQLGLHFHISSLGLLNDGKIILGSGSDGIYSFNPSTEKISRITKEPIIRSNQIVVSDSLIISLQENRGFDFFSLKTGETAFGDSILFYNCSNKALSVVKLKDNSILLGRMNGLYKLSGSQQIKIKLPLPENIPVYSIFENKNEIYLGSVGAIFKMDHSWKVIEKYIIEGENKLIRNIISDPLGGIWFNSWDSKDVYILKRNYKSHISQPSGIINGNITGIMQIANGVVLVTSINKGIFVFNNLNLLIYSETANFHNPNIRKIIGTAGGGLLLGTSDGLAYRDPNNDSLIQIKHFSKRTEYIKDITWCTKNKFVIGTVDPQLIKKFSEEIKYEFENITFRYSHCSSIWADSNWVVTGNWDNNLILYNTINYKYEHSKENIFRVSHNTHRINALVEDKYKRMWIGSQKGCCIINPEGEKFYPEGRFQNEEIFQITELNNDSILLVTNMGYYILKNSFEENRIQVIQNKIIQGVNCVVATGSNEFLIGTNHGLLFIQNSKSSLMNFHDGLPSDNINDILYIDSLSIAWLGTTEGLARINVNVLRENPASLLTVNEVLFMQDSKKWPSLTTNTFEYDNNSFSISFQSFHYQNPLKIRYLYKIDTHEWLPAPINLIQFASMEPGAHEIRLRAGLSGEIWGPERLIQVTILPPYYRTWWFYSLMIMLVAWLGMLFIRRQIRVLRKKQEEKTRTQQKILDLQQKALASNLNPHFIFNSLNAIQHFVNSKNNVQANEYLAKFSRLMRMHLNMADKSSIQLNEEIHRLEYYLALEQLRFDDKMEWSVKIDPDLEPYEIEIPNMIIQPFVENAIWHGIMPSTNRGFISIVIQPFKNKDLEIIISDNGVGMHTENKPKKHDHESKGILLIQERLMILDPAATRVITFEALNPGTLVRIRLTPAMFQKRLKTEPAIWE